MLEWKYKLSLHREKTNATAEITEPLSIIFDITRTTQTTPNIGKFTVSNLAENTRKAFEKMKPVDYVQNGEKVTNYGLDDYCSVIFTAQREGGIECVMFKGDLLECHSERSGDEWNTFLNCSDGYFAKRYASMNGHYKEDSNMKAIVERECKKFKLNMELNAEPTNIPVPITVKEEFDKSLGWIYPNNWYIDNNTLITGTRKDKTIYRIEQEQLGKTPKREQNVLEINTVLFPEPRLGNIVEVQSDDFGELGQWEVAGIKHNGEFPAGDMESDFTLIPPGARYSNEQ